MAIFTNITPQTPPTQPELTLAEKQVRVSRQLTAMGQRHYTQLCKMQKDGIDILWNNENLTPQEVSDSIGVNGSVLIAAHGALTSAIVSAATAAGIQPDIKLPTNAFTVNVDGTVTILDTPYIPS